MRLLITIFASATTLVALASATAAESGLTVTALDCTSHPRRVRIENLGDTAQDLSGWQLTSDPVEGEPFDLGAVGSIEAGAKFFVFQGHQAPATDPAAGYYRWGDGEIHNLRPNDSSDYVRIVDAQGNTVNQRNCEGLPPGATPAPPSEFDPPPIVVATPVPTAAPTAEPAPAAGALVTNTPSTTRAPRATGVGGPASVSDNTSELPQGGGPPGVGEHDAGTLAFAAAMAMMAAGALMATAGTKRGKPGA